jgi:hypothetical protein
MAKAKAALSSVPYFGEFLVKKRKISEEENNNLVKEARAKGIFIGKLAIEKNYINNDELNEILNEQAILKSEAAVQDINSLNDNIKLDVGSKIPHWGNNGVNEKIINPNRTDGASAAANVAEIILLLANQKLDNNTLNLIEGVQAAHNLTVGIISGSAKIPSFKEDNAKWMEAANNTLRGIAKVNNIDESIVNQYIENRFYEIRKGVNLALQLEHGKGEESFAKMTGKLSLDDQTPDLH